LLSTVLKRYYSHRMTSCGSVLFSHTKPTAGGSFTRLYEI